MISVGLLEEPYRSWTSASKILESKTIVVVIVEATVALAVAETAAVFITLPVYWVGKSPRTTIIRVIEKPVKSIGSTKYKSILIKKIQC